MTQALEAFRQRVNQSILTERINTPKPKSNMLHHFLPDNIWKDRRCFIIGGGPSVNDIDLSCLKGELTIGINRAFEFMDPSIIFSMDARFWEWLEKCAWGQGTLDRFNRYDQGIRCFVDMARMRLYPPELMLLDNYRGRDLLSPTLSEGVKTAGNSGYAALNLAILLGCNPIYLVGYDMRGGTDGQQANYHSGYPKSQSATIYPNIMIPGFVQASSEMLSRAQIVNLNPQSALRCFPFQEFEELRPIRRPIVISYYTEGSAYKEESLRLKDSLLRLGIEHQICEVPNRGSWQANTQYKAQFILEKVEQTQRPVLYVDADAMFEQYPALLDDFPHDFACHYRDGKELLSGTLYFGGGDLSRTILREWIDENERNKNLWDQRNLQTVLWRMGGKHDLLPAQYCCIFDLMAHVLDPVILHFQASRRLKGTI